MLTDLLARQILATAFDDGTAIGRVLQFDLVTELESFRQLEGRRWR